MLSNHFQKRIKAIAIDFDGVIVDSQPLHFQAWLEVFKKIKPQKKIQEKDILGVSVDDFIKSLGLPTIQASYLARLKKETVSIKAFENPPPLYPTVADTIKILSNKFKLALVTAAEPKMVEYILAHYDLKKYFTICITQFDYKNAKPHPDPYKVCINRLKLNSSEIISIEDSPAGVESAVNAGLNVIGILNTSSEPELTEAGSEINIFEFKDILKFINH